MDATWHYQPNPDQHRTACGRTDNIRRPFAMTEYPADVDCRSCLRWLFIHDKAKSYT
jgi:hypothetical protein